jgi:hypothetical protein
MATTVTDSEVIEGVEVVTLGGRDMTATARCRECGSEVTVVTANYLVSIYCHGRRMDLQRLGVPKGWDRLTAIQTAITGGRGRYQLHKLPPPGRLPQTVAHGVPPWK